MEFAIHFYAGVGIVALLITTVVFSVAVTIDLWRDLLTKAADGMGLLRSTSLLCSLAAFKAVKKDYRKYLVMLLKVRLDLVKEEDPELYEDFVAVVLSEEGSKD